MQISRIAVISRFYYFEIQAIEIIKYK